MQQRTATAPGPTPAQPEPTPADPAALTPLDRLETNRQDHPDTPQAINATELNQPVAWIHRGWSSDRDRIRAALVRTGASRSRVDSWDGCGGGLWVVESNDSPGTYQIRRAYCHDRLCRVCGTARAHRIGQNLRDQIAKRKHRLITLTLLSSTETLTELLDHLYQAFYDLRRSTLWTGNVKGGVAFLEIKYNRKLERWHPHLHIICEGRFIRAGDLARAWHAATKDSYISDIRMIWHPEKAIAYVTKYASRPLSSSFVRVPDRLDEAVTALHGRRLASTFGTWRGWKLTDAPDAGSWTYVAAMWDVVEQARRHSPFHISLLLLLNVKPGFPLNLPEPRPPPRPPDPTLPFPTPPHDDRHR